MLIIRNFLYGEGCIRNLDSCKLSMKNGNRQDNVQFFAREETNNPLKAMYFCPDCKENEEKMTSHLHDNKACLSTVYRISTERGQKG
ncbi:hypothetical protein TNCV_853331 [Trichonephila clavipes]|nr:hypothetical protein TNCV_853331 [Trichonephila clavipes]